MLPSNHKASSTRPRRRVVVVDDDASIREVCEDALAEAGYDVVSFAGGEDALATLGRDGAAVFVVDWKMPGLDGMEVARRARALDPRLPVLMVTGSAHEARAVARASGIAVILDKPFRVEELVAAVDALATAAAALPTS